MEFRKYEKILRLGKFETDGILSGTVVIQEKVDGANTSIWLGEDGSIQCGSRNRHLGDEEFNGFVPYAKTHDGITALFHIYPGYRLYGEWLVKHTITYHEECYRHFYLFDILRLDGTWLTPEEVYVLALEFGICTPKILARLENPQYSDILPFVGQSDLGDRGEGIVIKNSDFINTFGDRAHAKVVSESFKEDNGITFSSNDKYADHYWELYVVNKYITPGRIEKICNKLMPIIDEPLDMKHIPRVCEAVYHDVLTEEIYEIQKKVNSLEFKALKKICFKKAKLLYIAFIDKDVKCSGKV